LVKSLSDSSRIISSLTSELRSLQDKNNMLLSVRWSNDSRTRNKLLTWTING
jgi:hypothetical protein